MDRGSTFPRFRQGFDRRGSREDKREGRWTPFPAQRAPRRKIRAARAWCAGAAGARSGKPPIPRRREKPLGTEPETVPKPTQVGGYQYTKARERNLVKELGNLAP